MSKQGVQPSDANLKAIAECALPWTYTEIHVFLGLIGHYRQFIKGFTWIALPLNEHLAGEEASRKLQQVSLSEDALEAFQALKQACMSSPVQAFANYTKDFLLKTDASNEGLGSGTFPKTSRQALSPGCLWQPSTHSPWKELSFHQTGIPGTKMGHHRTL